LILENFVARLKYEMSDYDKKRKFKFSINFE